MVRRCKILVRGFRCRRVLFPIIFITAMSCLLYFMSLINREPEKEKALGFEQQIHTSLVPTKPVVNLYPDKKPIVNNENETRPKVELIVTEKIFQISDIYKLGTPITDEEIRGGQPSNETVAQRRDKVREMMKFAWEGYATYAWGANELKPLSKMPHSPYVLGSANLGASIIDGLDTLYIMKLDEQFKAGLEWIANNLDFNKNALVSVFEYNIRYLGGLLSAYTFTGDEILLTKAVQLAQRLLPAFDTPSGIPMSLINLRTGKKQNFAWARSQCSILSEFGSLHMEFSYLSELTGDPIYADKVNNIRNILKTLQKPDGFYYNYLNPLTKTWCGSEAGLSALGDSFYEYLLKEWLRTNHKDENALQMYNISMESFLNHQVFRHSKQHHLLYIGSFSAGSVRQDMDHLACFSGGMLALGAANRNDPWFDRAIAITETCRRSYTATAVGLGPEKFRFSDTAEAVAETSGHAVYLLRPETVESYFYLWRLTKDPKYRDWAWDVVQSLEKFSRTLGGYSGLRDVNSVDPGLDDVQQSYFLAETLKYLYLIFSEDTLLPLDRWVFNTEAHPLPIHTKVRLKN